ncbi:hypothetical protein [Acinetobacter guerrae]|nr:hypothetical protein [Acinetobacter guerrae]
MKFHYSTQTRHLIVFGSKMDHHFENVNASEIEALICDAKFKEAIWRA